jgi:large subunit ribosomal protein L24
MMLNRSKGSKKVRTGDTVLVIAGNNRGQTGKVLSCEADKVLVQGINICKKHVKRSEQNPKGGVIEMEKPIHVSNVQPCDENGKRLKLKVRIQDGQKELVYDVDGTPCVYRSMKKKG